MEKLKNYALMAAALIVVGLAAFACLQGRKLRQTQEEAGRLSRNQSALLDELRLEQNRAGELQATVQALTLRRDELEALVPKYEKRLRDMNIRLKDAQHLAQIATETAAQVTAHPDTVFKIVEGAPVVDTTRRFRFADDWIEATVTVSDTGAALRLSVRDSLTVVAHRERRRCIFRRPKVTHYTAVSASPYTTITGLSYVEMVEK